MSVRRGSGASRGLLQLQEVADLSQQISFNDIGGPDAPRPEVDARRAMVGAGSYVARLAGLQAMTYRAQRDRIARRQSGRRTFRRARALGSRCGSLDLRTQITSKPTSISIDFGAPSRPGQEYLARKLFTLQGLAEEPNALYSRSNRCLR